VPSRGPRFIIFSGSHANARQGYVFSFLFISFLVFALIILAPVSLKTDVTMLSYGAFKSFPTYKNMRPVALIILVPNVEL
jgi:hypothetical protein